LAGRVRLVDDLNTVDTGIGGPPVVDMGAYEFQGCEGNADAIAGVNLPDVAILAGRWMETDCGYCGGADLDGDRAVGMGDLMVQVGNWLCDAD